MCRDALLTRWSVFLVTAAVTLLPALPTRCEEMRFDAQGTYSWTNTTRWTPSRLPTVSDNVTIYLGGANRIMTLDGDAACAAT